MNTTTHDNEMKFLVGWISIGEICAEMLSLLWMRRLMVMMRVVLRLLSGGGWTGELIETSVSRTGKRGGVQVWGTSRRSEESRRLGMLRTGVTVCCVARVRIVMFV